jgi:hypothetical protein
MSQGPWPDSQITRGFNNVQEVFCSHRSFLMGGNRIPPEGGIRYQSTVLGDCRCFGILVLGVRLEHEIADAFLRSP